MAKLGDASQNPWKFPNLILLSKDLQIVTNTKSI